MQRVGIYMYLMDVAKRYYMNDDLNCAEAILYACNEFYGLEITVEDLKIAGGFGGGMFVGCTCGAICGSVMSLSKMFNASKAHQCPKLKDNVKLIMDKFIIEFHSLNCSDIKRMHYTTDTKCLNTVTKVAQILEKTIQENK